MSDVTPQMVAVALGQAAPEPGSITEAQWQMWIDDAQMLVDARAAELGVGTDTLSFAKVTYVVREAVVAHIKTPDDATQVTVSVDDGSESRTYQSGRGRVTIRAEWWALLGLVETGGGAFSIDTVAAGSYHLPWCALAFGALYCSCGVDIAGTPIFEIAD